MEAKYTTNLTACTQSHYSTLQALFNAHWVHCLLGVDQLLRENLSLYFPPSFENAHEDLTWYPDLKYIMP